MKFFIVFVIASALIQQAITADVANVSQPSCTRLHEQYSTCSNNCEPTCDNYKDPPMCTLQCVEGGGCYCESSYVRNGAGDCVLPSECPQETQVSQQICPLNSKYQECGSACPITCDNYKNPPTMCTANCVADCYCDSPYVKTSSGACVLPAECPKVSQPICPLHSTYNQCGSACPTTCDNYKNPPRACTRQCVADCFCQSPYVKDNASGTCVLTTQCKSKAVEPQKPFLNRYCIRPNEVYNPRGTLCPKTCATKDIMIKCMSGTQPGCFCAAGYLRNSKNRCVRVRNCD